MQAFASAIIVLWGWRRFAVAFVAGAFSALAFAPFDLFPILWITVPVFVWLIDGSEVSEGASWWRKLVPAAIVGFAFGFGFFVAGLWWIGSALLVDAGAFAWALPLAVAGLPAVLALFWALGAALARAFWTEGWPRLAVFAVTMAAAEWLRGHLLTGFPWNAFGYALTPMPLMMQTASLVGTWGLTLAAFFIFAAPVLLLPDRHHTRRASRVAFALAAVLYVAHIGYGAVRLSAGPDAMVPGVTFRIVQPAIPQDEIWESAPPATIMARYAELSRGNTGLEGITHLIWTESAFPFLLTENPAALKTIADLLPPGTTLFTGAARAERVIGSDDPPMVYNSIYAIDDAGEIRAAYDKVHLVPFGEYLPFASLLRAVGIRQAIAAPVGFSPGQTLRTLSVPGTPPFAPLICYEIIFPGAVVAPGPVRPQWMLNVTNDAWFGRTPGPYQHLEQARVRAVEEGLPLVRAANAGISAIVDAHGRVLASLDLDKVGSVDGGLPVALPPTPYARFGDWMFVGLLFVAAGGAAFGQAAATRKLMTDN
ncbi:MAG TPA: apolipoprotein N-acyltransferase [Bauldia sp.]|nr:apolipoprotein N-acyltransferase [Bauldia sp.]